MTGILPIKKYGKHSALNMFTEISMTDATPIPEFTGFTEDEVRDKCTEYSVSFDEMTRWYDGYHVNGVSIYNPKSVVESILRRNFGNYWTATETYEALKDFIVLDYDGLKEKISRMIAGEAIEINTTKFQNDMSVIRSKDDVLTVLIHLGYLSFDWDEEECYIPNREVAGEMVNAVKRNNWKTVVDALEQSKELLRATLDGDCEAVARGVDAAHDEHTSILSYNNENSLACVLSIAYYYARNDYVIHREFPSGKGFADLVLIPRKNVDSPAIVLELKYNKDADSGIDQILRKQYPAKVAQYADNLLLVAINYDKKEKTVKC